MLKDRMPALQVQSPEFKPQSHQGKKKKANKTKTTAAITNHQIGLAPFICQNSFS
jgi:hypothetical protein